MSIKEIIKDPSAKFVDVRTLMEFETGHVKTAVNIPLDQFAGRFREIEGLGSVPVIFYCRSGNRSGQAVNFLRQQGIQKIYNGGGLEDVQNHLN